MRIRPLFSFAAACRLAYDGGDMIDAATRLADYLHRFYAPDEFPALLHQAESWAIARPLKGLRILDGTPVFRNTLAKYMALLAAGAELYVPPPSVMPGDTAVLAMLAGCGIHVADAVEGGFDMVLDCAGAHAGLNPRYGFAELTRSGVPRFAGCHHPVFLADAGVIKMIETCLGTGESFFRAMEFLGYGDVQGRMLVVFGYGKVGRGLVYYALRQQMDVVVVDSVERSTEVPGGVRFVHAGDLKAVHAVLRHAWCAVTATGVRGALEEVFRGGVPDGLLLANMGVEDEFGGSVPTKRVLSDKKPLNFILEEPTSMCYIETTMALHNAGAVELLRPDCPVGVFAPSAELERELLGIVSLKGRLASDLPLLGW